MELFREADDILQEIRSEKQLTLLISSRHVNYRIEEFFNNLIMIHQNHNIFILPGYIFHNTVLTQSCMTGECFHLLLPGQPECFPHGNGLLLSFQNFGQINICFFQTYSFLSNRAIQSTIRMGVILILKEL